MFEDVPVSELPAVLGGHDFGAALGGTHDQQMGAERIDAIAALERVKRWTDANIAAQTAELDAQRCALANPQPGLGAGFVDEGQVARSLIAELALVRQMSNSGAAAQYGFAMTMRHLPQTMALLEAGTISQRVAKAVAEEVTTLTAAQTGWVDEQIAPDLAWLTARRAAQVARRSRSWPTPPSSASPDRPELRMWGWR